MRGRRPSGHDEAPGVEDDLGHLVVIDRPSTIDLDDEEEVIRRSHQCDPAHPWRSREKRKSVPDFADTEIPVEVAGLVDTSRTRLEQSPAGIQVSVVVIQRSRQPLLNAFTGNSSRPLTPGDQGRSSASGGRFGHTIQPHRLWRYGAEVSGRLGGDVGATGKRVG